jgi:hypothetical protein
MKNNKIISSVLWIIALLLANSCTDLLKESPQSKITPTSFATPSGMLSAIAGVYNNIRSAWGTEGFTVQQVTGTDECLEGGGSSSYHILCTYNGITGSTFSGGFGFYSDINVLNGILTLGPTTQGLDATTLKTYLGQAQFLRAFLYFYLVQTYGNIPMHTTFITTPSQADGPADPTAIYAVIVNDLKNAIANLPAKPTAPFLGKAAAGGAAKWLLSKVYLTRAWWTNTPADYDSAYNAAKDLIDNKGTYGFDLWQDYASAFNPANDYDKETIFVSDHSNDPKYGYYTPGGQQAGGGAINTTPWMGLSNLISNVGVDAKIDPAKINTDPTSLSYNPAGFASGGQLPLMRDVQFGRPFGRIRPNTNYLLTQAFADRKNDSRYDKTFQTLWLVNGGPPSDPASTRGGQQAVTGKYSGDGPTSSRGLLKCGIDTAIWFPDYEVPGAPQNFGSRPFKGVIINPSMQFPNAYPYMKKLADPSRVNQNDPSTRPVVIARFSDVYLIAAEAAFMRGDNTNAALYLNVIRQRAAYRSGKAYAPGGAFGSSTPATMVGDPYPAGVTYTSAVVSQTITPGQVTLDFILDERTREFYGEGMRWQDLVRTKQLVNRVKAWNQAAAPKVTTDFMLRPIPQDEIDRVSVGPKYPQNTGY